MKLLLLLRQLNKWALHSVMEWCEMYVRWSEHSTLSLKPKFKQKKELVPGVWVSEVRKKNYSHTEYKLVALSTVSTPIQQVVCAPSIDARNALDARRLDLVLERVTVQMCAQYRLPPPIGDIFFPPSLVQSVSSQNMDVKMRQRRRRRRWWRRRRLPTERPRRRG